MKNPFTSLIKSRTKENPKKPDIVDKTIDNTTIVEILTNHIKEQLAKDNQDAKNTLPRRH